MKVSVIIPAYQAEKYIARCIQSVLDQTLKEIEIIIVNDGSTDMTPQVIKYFESKYSNIRVIHQSNQGIVRAKSRAIEEVKGEYVLIIDDDDWIHPMTLEKLYRKAIAEEADLVFYNYIQVREDIGYLGVNFEESADINHHDVIEGAITHKFWPMPMWSKLIKSDYIKKINYSDVPSINYWEDYVVSILLALQHPKVTYITDHLYYWNIHSESTSAKIGDGCAQDISTAYRYLIHKFKEVNLYETYKELLNQRLEETNNWMQSLKELNPSCAQQLLEFYHQNKL